MTMYIQASSTTSIQNYNQPFATSNKQDEEQAKQEEEIVVNATEMKDKQNHNKQSRIEAIYKRIDKLEEDIQNIKVDPDLTREIKNDKIKILREEIEGLKEDIIITREQEQEERIREAEEKQQEKEENEEAKLTPEERERKVQEAQQKMLSGIAGAMSKISESRVSASKANEYETEGKLGMGPKYKGNLSVAELDVVFSKAAKYGRKLSQSLQDAQQSAYLTKKVAKTYQDYKTQVEEEKNAKKQEEKNEPEE